MKKNILMIMVSLTVALAIVSFSCIVCEAYTGENESLEIQNNELQADDPSEIVTISEQF